jgi:hypothetical protein
VISSWKFRGLPPLIRRISSWLSAKTTRRTLAPKDRACAHRTRLGAGVERAALEEVLFEAGARQTHQVRLGVAGDVALGPDGVLGLEHDVAVLVDQERAERVVSVLAGTACELDCSPQVAFVVGQGRRPY